MGMRILPALALLAALGLTLPANGQTKYGEITLENRTPEEIHFFIDGTYRCGPFSTKPCIVTVLAGVPVEMSGRDADGNELIFNTVNLKPGESVSWVISYE